MHFSAKFIALVATTLMPLLVSAVQLTNSAYSGITAGQQFTLTWSGDGTPVKIVLETNNSNNNLEPVNVLTSSSTGTSLTVNIPSVPSGTYAFKIKQSGQVNYSPQFSLSGTSGSPTQAIINNNNNNNNNNDNYNNNNNNNGQYYTNTSPYTSLTTSLYTSLYTYPTTTSTSLSSTTYSTVYTSGYYNNNNNNNNPGVTQINDGQIQAASNLPYNSFTTSCTTMTSAEGQYYTTSTPGQYFASTSQSYYTTPSSVFTQTGVVSFQGAAPKVVAGAGAAAVAGGVAFLLAL